MTDAYTKQLEAENAKLREILEKQDATLGEFIRNRLEVKKDKDGSLHLRLKQKRKSLNYAQANSRYWLRWILRYLKVVSFLNFA